MLTGNEFQTLQSRKIEKHEIKKIGYDGNRKLVRTGAETS